MTVIRPVVTYEVGPTVACLCGCGEVLLQFDASGRERFYRRGHHMRVLWREVKVARPVARSA